MTTRMLAPEPTATSHLPEITRMVGVGTAVSGTPL